MFRGVFQDKTVWLSGHTGFKGAWLAQWLLGLGARVHGFALEAPTEPALFTTLNLARNLQDERGDVRDFGRVRDSILRVQPDFVFHLAAQSLVRLSYQCPIETYATNVMGTLYVLEVLKELKKPCSSVIVTTDKCYENREWVFGYREEDPMGGADPYSSSKGMAELGIAAYRRSFFKGHPVRIASARAGNVIGGGDWALDRIVPDCVRALQKGEPILVRNKTATRPWQHVLDPLSGYLWLAAILAEPSLGKFEPSNYDSAFNFGPNRESNRTVEELVREVLVHWPGSWFDKSDPRAVHEAKLLQLSTDKAFALTGWQPVWSFAEAIKHTIDWHRAFADREQAQSMRIVTEDQIRTYSQTAAAKGLVWAQTY